MRCSFDTVLRNNVQNNILDEVLNIGSSGTAVFRTPVFRTAVFRTPIFFCACLCFAFLFCTSLCFAGASINENANSKTNVNANANANATQMNSNQTVPSLMASNKIHPKKVIGITQIVEHPALDNVRRGMLDELNREGYVEGQNLTVIYENAQGSVVTSSQIAKKLLSQKLDVAVAISTPSAQTLYFTAQKQQNKIPIVFTAVSDPTIAKLEINKDRPYPITGVTDAPHLDALMEVIGKMMPKLRILGILYNPSEPNSVATMLKLRKMLEAKNIQSHEVTVSKTADVAQAMQSLIGKVDALYFPQDNTVVAAIETVIGIASQSQPPLPVFLPIFSSDPDLVKKGVVAGVGYDYIDVGRETGDVVGQILSGVKADEIPIHSPKKVETIINRDLAEKYGLSIPATLKFSQLTFLGK